MKGLWDGWQDCLWSSDSHVVQVDQVGEGARLVVVCVTVDGAVSKIKKRKKAHQSCVSKSYNTSRSRNCETGAKDMKTTAITLATEEINMSPIVALWSNSDLRDGVHRNIPKRQINDKSSNCSSLIQISTHRDVRLCRPENVFAWPRGREAKK